MHYKQSILHSATRWIKVWEQKTNIKCRNGVCMKNYAEQSEAEKFFLSKFAFLGLNLGKILKK